MQKERRDKERRDKEAKRPWLDSALNIAQTRFPLPYIVHVNGRTRISGLQVEHVYPPNKLKVKMGFRQAVVLASVCFAFGQSSLRWL